MLPSFRDRLTGRTFQQLPSVLLPGQFSLMSGTPANINSVPAQPGEFVVPTITGAWVIGDSINAQEISRGYLAPRLWLPANNELENQSLKEIGALLELKAHATIPIDEWLDVTPIVQTLDEFVRPNHVDQGIRDWLKHLQEVCARPQSYLRVDEERLLIDRVKRVATQAVEDLASHPEDWAARQYRSVVPKRILALLPEDEFNLYENRLAARLIERLDRHLSRRIRSLRQFRITLKQATIENGTTWRFRRIGRLVEKSFDNPNDAARQIEALLNELESWHYKVLQLYGSPLYQRVPRGAQVPQTLQPTNILINDRHYRYVGELWRSLARPPRTDNEEYAEAQQSCRAFNVYCALLVIWALNQLRYTPGPGTFGKGTGPFIWSGSAGDVTLEWQPDDVLMLRRAGDQAEYRVVPLPAALTADVRPDMIRQYLATLGDELAPALAANPNLHVMVLYPGSIEERHELKQTDLQLEVERVGHELPVHSSISLLPVSLLEADSVERVARAFRWWIWQPHILNYPIALADKFTGDEVQGLIRIGKDQGFLSPGNDQGRFNLRRPIGPSEWHQLEAAISERHLHLKRKDGIGAADDRVRIMRRFEQALQTADITLANLLICPVCGQNGAGLTPWDEEYYECQCSCGASWGVTRCGHCQKKIPHLMPGSVPGTRQTTAHWLDDVIGCDALAAPCWLGRPRTFICPECGVCQRVEAAEANGGCGRCGMLQQKE
jgi:hypothetical protein